MIEAPLKTKEATNPRLLRLLMARLSMKKLLSKRAMAAAAVVVATIVMVGLHYWVLNQVCWFLHRGYLSCSLVFT